MPTKVSADHPRIANASNCRWPMRAFGPAISIDALRNKRHADHTKADVARPECGPLPDAFAAEGCVSVGRDYNFNYERLQVARL